MIADGALLDEDPLESEWQKWLDARHGSCVLEIPCVRELVIHALRVFAGVRYELGEHVVAPNHVHALIRTALEVDLSDVLHSWKSYTGHEILKIDAARLRFGRFVTSAERPNVWQKESFDHLVRNAGSLERFEAYIRGHEGRDR